MSCGEFDFLERLKNTQIKMDLAPCSILSTCQFDHNFEIDLMGLSSLLLPSWTPRTSDTSATVVRLY